MVKAICKELELRKNYLNHEEIKTIYFGGGTPSLLTEQEFDLIFNQMYKLFRIAKNPEITLEANPDDLTLEKSIILAKFPINRLSIGIQSFSDEHLTFMNRAHSSLEAKKAIENVKNVGFNNLSLDLIYGIPSLNHTILENDLSHLLALKPNHISAYCLTIEEKTPFGKWTKNGKLAPISDEFSAQQFEIVIQTLKNNAFEQYEISNFCTSENYAQHNTAYWQGKSYLGIGPGAHSYNGISRSYAVANNSKYTQAIEEDLLFLTTENLTPTDSLNDYILTGIRTKWGINDVVLKQKHNYSNFSEINNLISEKLLYKQNDSFILTEKGKLLADWVAERLFI